MRQLMILPLALALVGCTCANPTQEAPGASSSGCNPVQEAPGAAPGCVPPAAPMAAAPEDVAHCGQLPPEAKPGEVWCCVPIEPPAAPPERVCVQPECQKEILIPAVYESYTEQVQVSPEKTEWQRTDCAAAGQVECWRLVNTPAAFETVTRQRLVSPATVRYERIPAVFQEVPAAPQAPVYQWRRRQECEVAPMAAPAAAPCDTPPAGPAR